MKKSLTGTALCLMIILIQFPVPAFAGEGKVFTDDFESDLRGWEILSRPDVVIRPSMDKAHGNVLVLIPNGDVYALVKGSNHWNGIRMEGDFLFPDKISNYLGIIYNFRHKEGRSEFGDIYIKGDGSYLQANPHRDMNVGRTLYPEYHVNLAGPAAIEIGKWNHFKVEVIKNECHFYVGDMAVPQETFVLPDLNSGMIGLQPRSVGGDVWVDNISVDAIDTFSYHGERRPNVAYEKGSLLTRWEVLGPLEKTMDRVAMEPGNGNSLWRAFPADERGAVLTGIVTDYHGPRTVAYFRTQFQHGKAEDVSLNLSTVDDLAIWVNGRFCWFISRGENAWFDFWKNPDHAGQSIPISLREGENEIVLRVRGGVYASGGFYARLEPAK